MVAFNDDPEGLLAGHHRYSGLPELGNFEFFNSVWSVGKPETDGSISIMRTLFATEASANRAATQAGFYHVAEIRIDKPEGIESVKKLLQGFIDRGVNEIHLVNDEGWVKVSARACLKAICTKH